MQPKNFYEVRLKSCCPQCEGRKFIEHPKWSLFTLWESQVRQNQNRIPTPAESREWWDDQGYIGASRPDEEIACPRCEGTGTLITFIPLEQALSELGIDIKNQEDTQ